MPATLLVELQQAQGGVFNNPGAPPRHFGEPAREARAARESAALFDFSDWSRVEIVGADRKSFLHNFCTNDVNALEPGGGCEAFLTNIKGRILGHVLVSERDDALRLVSVPGTAEAIVEHLDRYLISEDARLSNVSAEVAGLCLIGPAAADVLHEQFGVDAGALSMCANVRSGVVEVLRVPFAPQPGYLLSTGNEAAADLWRQLTGAGVAPAGRDVWHVLRIAARFPLYGVDISEENIAQEANRTAQAISFHKGCYLGQEPIARLDALGHVNRLLCSVRFAAAGAALAVGTTVLDQQGGQEIGAIKSSAIDPVDGRARALAMLKAGFAASGSKVAVRGPDGVLRTGRVGESV